MRRLALLFLLLACSSEAGPRFEIGHTYMDGKRIFWAEVKPTEEIKWTIRHGTTFWSGSGRGVLAIEDPEPGEPVWWIASCNWAIDSLYLER